MHVLTKSIAASALAAALVAPAGAVILVYGADFSAEAVGATGTGNAVVVFDTDAVTMRVQATFAGLSGTSTVAHIHCCTGTPGTGTAGVATYPGTFPSWPTGVTSGTYDQTFNMALAGSFNTTFLNNNGGTPASALTALLGGIDAGRAYFNVHSSTFAGGEIRGFLAPIPEPSTYALMLAGLAAVGWVARRRRGG